MTEVVAQKDMLVQMTCPEDENDKFYQTYVQLEMCQEEPILDNNEESDIERTSAGMNMKKELKAMKDFGVYDEVQIGDDQES